MAIIQTAVIHGLGTNFPGDYTILGTQGLVYGRVDNESGNSPVPYPLAAPTTAYSWFKAISLVIPAGGTDATAISNIAIRKTATEPKGIGLFYRVVPAYVPNNGSMGVVVDNAGNSTGNFPANNLDNHSGNTANTPLGYNPLPVNPFIISTATFTTNSVGKIGPTIQIVCGVGDRKVMGQPAGALVLPNIEITFDEFAAP